MRRKSLSRREFIKLAAAAPLALSPLAYLLAEERPDSFIDSEIGKVSSGQPPNILIIVFDALTAANLSLYGYPRQTSANLERLADRALVYHQHHAAGTFTCPGMASLLTGVYPWSHRTLHLESLMLPHYSDRNLFSQLPVSYYKFAYTQNPLAYALLNQAKAHIQDLPNLHDLAVFSDTFTEDIFYRDYYLASEAEDLLLKEDSDPPASLFLSLLDKLYRSRANTALAQQYRQEFPRGLVNCRNTNPGVFCFTLEEAVDWTIARVKSAPQPFMGYVHFFPPHAPYNPRVEFTRLFDDGFQAPKKPDYAGEAPVGPKAMERYRRFYDQSIAYVDAEFDRLFSSLEAAGALANTMVILTSDHGEMLERGVWGHTSSAVYEPLAHIPLLVFPPGQAARQDIHIPTAAVDLLPTLLNLTGAQAGDYEGAPLPGLNTAAPPDSRSIFTMDAKTNPKLGPLTRTSLAIISWPYKLIRYEGRSDAPDGFEMYDLTKNSEELKDIYSPDLSEAKHLREELEGQLEEHAKPQG